MKAVVLYPNQGLPQCVELPDPTVQNGKEVSVTVEVRQIRDLLQQILIADDVGQRGIFKQHHQLSDDDGRHLAQSLGQPMISLTCKPLSPRERPASRCPRGKDTGFPCTKKGGHTKKGVRT